MYMLLLAARSAACHNTGMEHESLEYKVVMDDGPHNEVLGCVRDLEFGFAVFTAAVEKYPKRNIYLRQGVRIINQHIGVPRSTRRRSRTRRRA
jgi:hypothetical protein